MHVSNPSTAKAVSLAGPQYAGLRSLLLSDKAGGSYTQGLYRLQNEFKTNLGNLSRYCLKTK